MKPSITVKVLVPVVAAGILLGVAGCATTRQVPEDKRSGFLGDYSMLRKGPAGRADYYYIDQKANWAKFTKVWVKPVELWQPSQDSALGRMSQESKRALVDFYYAAAVSALTNNFQLVEQSGPDVLVIHTAITEARPSMPVVDLVSSVYPALVVASYGKREITGTDIGVGEVVVEAELIDGQSNQRIGAAMDERVGTKSLSSKFGGTWADVNAAFEWWAQLVNHRLSQFKAGDFSAS